jgi:prefoldin subunit 5
MKGELISEIRRLDGRIDGVDRRMDSLEREVRTAMEIRERLAALEARRE